MIAPGTELRVICVRLSQIRLNEFQPRYLSRVEHYVGLLSDPAYRDHYAGLVHVVACGVNSATHEPIYTLLDGHHRFVASILTGRETMLAVLHIPPPTAQVRELPRETVQLDDYETLALLPAVNTRHQTGN